MRILVVGGGAREHAICWSLARSRGVDRIFCAPGNPGIAELATSVPIPAEDVDGLVEFASDQRIDLTVVGPEAPLVAGLIDELEARGLVGFGPSRQAARLEGSKVWARELCRSHGIPVPRSAEFTELEPALGYLEETDPPYVVKADGLAAGKGVTIAEDRASAREALEDCLVRRVFGGGGDRVLIEEFLTGREVSAMALTDGKVVLPLVLARDHKQAFDGDRGPNTGGMGAYSPVPSVGPDVEDRIVGDVLEATVEALRDEETPFRGVLFAGLMLTEDGPKVLEFNCRLGDPETQVVLPRLDSDAAELFAACAAGDLAGQELRWSPEACAGVVIASGGYPGAVRTGFPIRGLKEAAARPGVQVFHAGTAARDGRVLTAGGRVLTVTGMGPDVAQARERAYEACAAISFEDMRYRTDIGNAEEEER